MSKLDVSKDLRALSQVANAMKEGASSPELMTPNATKSAVNFTSTAAAALSTSKGLSFAQFTAIGSTLLSTLGDSLKSSELSSASTQSVTASTTARPSIANTTEDFKNENPLPKILTAEEKESLREQAKQAESIAINLANAALSQKVPGKTN